MSRYRYHPDGMLPDHGEVFVFGSNLSGIHGKGAALVAAREYGAEWGYGVGRRGHSYAIPTKRTPWERLSKDEIRPYVRRFLRHAANHPDTNFFVTRVGCGLAGNRDADIAPMFGCATPNCLFPEEWAAYLEDVRV